MMYTGFILGLISGLHCVGMCGPLLLAVNKMNPSSKVFAKNLVYHLGRLYVYGVLGVAASALGFGFSLVTSQKVVSIGSGILMIGVFFIYLFDKKKLYAPWSFGWLKRSVGNLMQKHTLWANFLMGMLNGFLPCGIVYAALIGAMGQQNMFLGGIYMVSFGVGTSVLLFSLAFAEKWIKIRLVNFQKLIPYTLLLVGIIFLFKGITLNSKAHINSGDGIGECSASIVEK